MTPEEMQAAIEALQGLSNTNLEIFYYWCTAIMILIHAGFLMYEMGASRVKHSLASGTKNILAFAFMIPTFYMFGWLIYLSMWQGFTYDPVWGEFGLPMSAIMGPNMADQATGVFWGAFTLFACTTASILSGAVIERIRMASFVVLAVILGSVVWNLAASWGWHPAGWLVTEWGYHDAVASGVVHTISGFFALGVLINLGPRIGKFNADGSANVIRGHSLPMTITGLMLIVVGFFGFIGACVLYNYGTNGGWVNIYGGPTTLSAYLFNTLMAVAGGIIGCYACTRDPFWMMSGALCGVISAAAGLDLWYPPLAFAIAFVGGYLGPWAAKQIEKMGIDDAVGAVSVHGICGVWGLLAVGIFLGGYPGFSSWDGFDVPSISMMGQIVGAAVMIATGFIPGYVLSWLFNKAGILRAGDGVQRDGMDHELEGIAYPEEIRSH
ncbi:MAG TPA: ammonium transporter [Oceanospirillaceae bacterium]|nr:ammonium transporter [Oceanospirillaceae bacterium]